MGTGSQAKPETLKSSQSPDTQTKPLPIETNVASRSGYDLHRTPRVQRTQ